MLYKSQLEGKRVHNIIVRGPTSSSRVGILLPVFYFALYFASVIRLSVNGNFQDCAEKNGLYLKLKEMGDILRSGDGSVPGEDYMKGTVVALTGFMAFGLAMASLMSVAVVCTLIWGE